MKKTVLFGIIFFMSLSFIKAQSSEVRIIDLTAFPVLKEDSFNLQPPTNYDVIVLFKVNKAALCSKAYICIGTAKDVCDIAMLEADFINEGTQYYLQYNGEKRLINKYDASVMINLTQEQFFNSNYRVYVKDKNGLETEKLYKLSNK
jgi:hypothetical protein